METLTKIILASIKEISAVPEEQVPDYNTPVETVGPTYFPWSGKAWKWRTL